MIGTRFNIQSYDAMETNLDVSSTTLVITRAKRGSHLVRRSQMWVEKESGFPLQD
jgi:hypothetical protein